MRELRACHINGPNIDQASRDRHRAGEWLTSPGTALAISERRHRFLRAGNIARGSADRGHSVPVNAGHRWCRSAVGRRLTDAKLAMCRNSAPRVVRLARSAPTDQSDNEISFPEVSRAAARGVPPASLCTSVRRCWINQRAPSGSSDATGRKESATARHDAPAR